MRERAIRTNLDPTLPLINISRIPRTILQAVHGAITKETIELLQAFMTGIIFALLIFKKTM